MDKTGNQNPTNSVILSTKNSDVEKAMELYQKSGREAFPWQKKLLRAILSKNDSELWTHTKCGYAVPRRNGKNEIVIIRELYGLYVGEQINHTAHLVNTSHAAFERLQKVLGDAGIKYESIKATGRERITLSETGGKIEFRTRTSTGGLGEGFDLLVIDEAQEYTEDQESALKYVVGSPLARTGRTIIELQFNRITIFEFHLRQRNDVALRNLGTIKRHRGFVGLNRRPCCHRHFALYAKHLEKACQLFSVLFHKVNALCFYKVRR